MTYDEWAASQSPTPSPSSLPSPPFPSPSPDYSVGGIQYGGSSPAQSGSPLGAAVQRGFRRAFDVLPPFMQSRPTANPSFSPMAGERLALQMPGAANRVSQLIPALMPGYSTLNRSGDFLNRQTGDNPIPLPGYRDNSGYQPPPRPNPPPSIRRDLSRLRDWWTRTGYQDQGPGLRDMPRYNTGPAPTPYPRPPWLNLGNWMDTGERGPIPLQWYSPGGYPAPANTPMPQAYDARISGGALA